MSTRYGLTKEQLNNIRNLTGYNTDTKRTLKLSVFKGASMNTGGGKNAIERALSSGMALDLRPNTPRLYKTNNPEERGKIIGYNTRFNAIPVPPPVKVIPRTNFSRVEDTLLTITRSALPTEDKIATLYQFLMDQETGSSPYEVALDMLEYLVDNDNYIIQLKSIDYDIDNRNTNNVETIGGSTRRFVTLSKRYINDLRLLGKGSLGNSAFRSGSDPEEITEGFTENTVISARKINHHASGFFPMINTFNKIDLSEFQIYTSYEEAKEKMTINCLLHSLKQYGISEHKLFNLIKEIGLTRIRKIDLTKIGKMLDIQINLTSYDDKVKKLSKYTYNHNTNLPVVKIFTFMNHYMLQKQVPISLYAINNYHKINNEKDFTSCQMVNNGRKKLIVRRPVSTSIIKILRAMTSNGAFVKDIKLLGLDKGLDIDTIQLENIEEEQSEVTYKPRKKHDQINIYSCDFESDTTTYEFHTPWMLGCVNHETEKYDVFVKNDKNDIFTLMLENMIKDVPNKKEILMYFHNAKYDFALIKANKYIVPIKKIVKNGQFYSFKFMYKSRIFTIHDSYKLINSKLDNFGSLLEIPVSKLKFDMYDLMKVGSTIIPIDTIKDKASYKNRDQPEYAYVNEFIHIKSGIKNGRMTKIESFDIQGCCLKYLKLDCITLMTGLKKFRDMMFKITNLDVYSYLTKSGITHDYYKTMGVYDGIYEVSGVLLNFLMKAVVGGRVFNKKKMEYNNKIQDFDACSLYPSAMSISNYPKGKAKLLTEDQMNFDFLNQQDFYVIEVETVLHKSQQIPMFSYKDDSGIRRWVNESKGKYVIDKIALEDFVNFHEAEVTKIYRGVYWNEGYNNKIREVVTNIYTTRKELEKNNPALGDMYKLIMNEAYGKTLTKSTTQTIKYIKNDEERLIKYLERNFSFVMDITEYNDNYLECRNRDLVLNHKNLAHIGATVLSTSKRIVNQVLGMANDFKIPILYTDTDSIHMFDKDVDTLSKLFKARYERELVGSKMLQFHCDFKRRNLEGPKIWSKKFIAIDKKIYLDVVTDGIGEYHHIRYKGIGDNIIKKYCSDNSITIEDFYQQIMKGDKLELDLCNGGISFEHVNGKVRTRKTFVRRTNVG